MSYRIEFTSSATRQCQRLALAIRARLDKRVLALEAVPRPPGAVKLAGHRDLYRLRVGDYRIIYAIQDEILVVVIVKVGHRRDVYR